MDADYEDLPYQVRELRRRAARLRAEWAALRAETSGSATLFDIVGLLRRRGRVSGRRAKALFRLLIIVIVLGLGYYLGLPFWQRYVDGRRAILAEQVQTIAAQIAQIDTQIDGEVTRLVDTLAATFTFIDAPVDAAFFGHARVPGGFLVYGEDGTMFRVGPDGSIPEDAVLETPTEAHIRGHVPLEDGLLFYGEGTVFRTDRTGALLEDDEDVEDEDDAEDDDGDEDSDSIGAWLLGHAVTADKLFLFGTEGALFQTDADGTLPEATRIETRTEAGFFGSVPVAGPPGEPEAFVLYGEDGILLRVASEGAPRAGPPFAAPSDARIAGHVPLPSGILFYGDEGTFFRTDLSVTSLDGPVIETPADDADILGHVVQEDGLLFYGGDGILFRTASDGSLVDDELIQIPTDDDIIGHIELDDGILFYGDSDDELLLWSGRSAIYLRERVDAAMASAGTGVAGSMARAAVALAKANAVDSVIRDELQPHLAALPEVQASLALVQILRGQIETLSGRLRGFEANLERLARFPNSLIRETELRDFGAFMATCRGGAAPEAGGSAPEPLTLACLQGWQAQMETDRENLWQTLAQQVPPGILLLFLLSTLGGLYRYNMRMAGFYDSRADALEAMGLGHSREDWDEAIRLSEALAADKVEFGKGNTPSDQALELAKAIVNRSR